MISVWFSVVPVFWYFLSFPVDCKRTADQCVICISAKATMQTFPCAHRVVCRRCFVKTIQVAVSQRLLPLRCVVCRTKILRLKQTTCGGIDTGSVLRHHHNTSPGATNNLIINRSTPVNNNSGTSSGNGSGSGTGTNTVNGKGKCIIGQSSPVSTSTIVNMSNGCTKSNVSNTANAPNASKVSVTSNVITTNQSSGNTCTCHQMPVSPSLKTNTNTACIQTGHHHGNVFQGHNQKHLLVAGGNTNWVKRRRPRTSSRKKMNIWTGSGSRLANTLQTIHEQDESVDFLAINALPDPLVDKCEHMLVTDIGNKSTIKSKNIHRQSVGLQSIGLETKIKIQINWTTGKNDCATIVCNKNPLASHSNSLIKANQSLCNKRALAQY